MAVTKVINSESKQYKPVLTDMLVLDAVPTVNSLNGVTSDAVARAIAGASGEVPQVTENDNGKVLTAIYDEGGAAVEWAEAQGGGDVDQTYDATSTNAQSGVAVAQAIAAIPSDVTTASGYFELGGTNPVKVNYTGTPERSITDTPLVASDLCTYHTNPSLVSEIRFVFINPVGGLRSLDTDTATLKVKVNSILAACNAPADASVMSTSGIMYGMNGGNFGGPSMNGSITVSDGDITEQTVTLSGANQALGSCGDYIEFSISIFVGSYDAGDTCSRALIAAAQNGELFEIDWPVVAESGKTITTIPNIPASTALDENKVLTVNSSGNAVWATPATPSVDEVPAVTSTDDGKVLTASYSGGQGSYSWQTAQGGGGGGGASYTAGQGIAIDGNNAISVDASSSDFTFGQYSSLPKWSNNYNFLAAYYPDSSVICTKDSYISLNSETGNVHLVCDNTGMVAGNYAVCNANYAFSNWRLTSDVKIEISKTASDWTFTGNTFTLDNGLWYITIAGTTGSTVTPNGETPVMISDIFDTARFDVITNLNQLSLKNSIPTVDQSYNASSTHAQSGTAVAQALASAGGGITWTKITSMTTTSYSLAANFSYSIPSGKTAVQVTLMLRLSEISGSWSNIPKQLSVKLKLGDGNGSYYNYVGSIIAADAWGSGSQPTIWMAAGTVVVPRDWYTSIDGIELELPYNGSSSLPSSYTKALFVGIA